MKTYLVSYDLLNKDFYDYEVLINYIKTYPSWAKPLESTWLIKTDKTISSVRDELKSQAAEGDKIFVINVTNTSWATSFISKEVTDWMKENL